MTMILPDYAGGSIVNLMATISHALGGETTGYPPVAGLPLDALGEARNLLLLVVDGMGWHYLQARAAESVMARYNRGRLTSVFPSTTASAIPAFLTGLAPLQHGFTGWFTWFGELGSVLAVLPFQTRIGALPIPEQDLTPMTLSGTRPFSSRLPVQSHCLMPDWIAGSLFNRAFAGTARIHPYTGLEGLQRTVLDCLNRAGGGRNYIYAYWPEFDTLAHEYGVGSRQVLEHFHRLDGFFTDLLAQLQGTDTALLVTADHGFIDTTAQRSLQLADHPQLAQTLQLPLCGEPRMAFCYVRPEQRDRFEGYLREELSHQVTLYPSHRLLTDGWFGRGAPHPRLDQRIGHYALVMKENYCISDRLPGERAKQHIGVHGGISAQEMYVPLIYAEA